MKLYLKKVYECEYCGRLFRSNSKGISARGIAHERNCFLNPNNKRPCNICKNREKIEATKADFSGTIAMYYCTVHETFLRSPVNRIVDVMEPIRLMPVECDYFVRDEKWKLRKKVEE